MTAAALITTSIPPKVPALSAGMYAVLSNMSVAKKRTTVIVHAQYLDNVSSVVSALSLANNAIFTSSGPSVPQ